jgi:hypothetical protein
LGSYAQDKPAPVNEPDYNKPKLFDGLPEKIRLSADDLNGLFSTALGRAATLQLSDDTRFRFEGEVVSSANQAGNSTQSLVIRSTNFNGATFTISKTTGANGTVSYRGRIISFKHGDLYELQSQNGQYMLVKRNYYDLVNE